MAQRIRATRPHMPGYGISRDGAALRPWRWAERILRAGHNYWLATTRPDGRPHAMPVWAVWHAGALWFSSGAKSRKARNLAVQHECSVGTERGKGAVIVEGAVKRIAASKVPREIAKLYAAKYGEGYPESSPLFRVDPRVVFGFSEATGEFTETATRWLFGRE
ncbi:MAG TPA: pyridoxamine 5'-phosphate oxidase family protein [Myxococcota bacterium]|nr:pyridoxamine 5'-phosphate oxidase family protein [Myxococcota bacterium]